MNFKEHDLSFTFFISNKLNKSNKNGEKISRPIVLISIFIIALATIVNLLAISIVTGYQKEVKNKILGFVAPIFISKIDADQLNDDTVPNKALIFESEPIPNDSVLVTQTRNILNVEKIEAVLYRPALLYSKKIEKTTKNEAGMDSSFLFYENKDVLCKGVETNYDWKFIEQYLVEGAIPNSMKNKIIISEATSKLLQYEIDDTVNLGFITMGNMPLNNYIVVGIYNTGFKEYDDRIVFGDLSTVQEGCGLKILNYFQLEYDHENDRLDLQVRSNVPSDKFRCFKNGKIQESRIEITDFHSFNLEIESINFANDIELNTYQIEFKPLNHEEYQFGKLEDVEINGNRTHDISFQSNTLKFKMSIVPINQSNTGFISGYEIGVENEDLINETRNEIASIIGLNADLKTQYLQVTTVYEAERDLFVWLDLLDMNVYVIIALMLVIGIVNAGSAIVVLISVKRNFIGILKALGASNWSIRKIFLIHAGTIILKGLMAGNIIGLSLVLIQKYFRPITLNPDVYYLDYMPTDLSWSFFILMNILSFLVCVISLIIPTFVITRIDPIKSIKFN